MIPFYYGSASGSGTKAGTAINYSSGSAKAKRYGSYGSGSATLIASLLFLMYYTVDFNLHFLFYPLIAGS